MIELLLWGTILMLVGMLFYLWSRYIRLKVEVEKVNLKELMNKYHQLQTRHQIIMDYLPVGVDIFDKDGFLVSNNQCSKQVLEGQDEAVYGKANFRQYINLDARQQKTLANGGSIDTRFTFGDAPQRHLHCIIKTVLDGNRTIGGYVGIVVDETEIVEVNKKLNDSKQDLSLVLEAANMQVWEHNLNTDIITYFNKDFTPGTSMRMDEHMKLKDPSDKEVCEKVISSLLSGERKRAKLLFHYIDSSIRGGFRICESSVMPKLEDGKVVKMLGTERDITDSYLFQKDLEESQLKYRQAIKSSGIIQWNYDVVTRKASVMNVYGRMHTWSVTLDQCMGYVHPHDLAKCQEQLSDVLVKRLDVELRVDLRVQFPQIEGYQLCTFTGVVSSRDQQGVPLTYIGFITNNTKWYEVNHKLDMANHQNTLILNNVDSALIYLTSDYSVLWENASHYYGDNLFGDRCSYKVGGHCYEHLGRHEVCKNCIMHDLLTERDVHRVEFALPDGRTLEVVTVPVIENDVVEGAVLRIDNITERKRVMNELEEAKLKAESANTLKSAFLANMSHEIRTPLNAIVGFSSLMGEASEEEREEYQKIISFNSDNLLNLINDILDLSKIEAGYIDFTPAPLDLADLFRGLDTNYRQRVAPGVQFVMQNPYARCDIEYDRQRLLQVINNYMSNAMKFTSEGSITLGYEYQPGQGVRVFVKDTGRGISEANKCKVFQRFEKLNSYAQGTGLGLSICKAIADKHGDTVGFESVEGKGTTFWILLNVLPRISDEAKGL